MFRKVVLAALVFSGLTALGQPASVQLPEAGPLVPLMIEHLTGERATIELRTFDGQLQQRLVVENQRTVTLNVAPVHGYFVVYIEDASGRRALKYHRP